MQENLVEVINKIREIECEQDKRKGLITLQTYNTGEKVHQKQLMFHKSKKRNRWVFGGNRTGKTECGAVECVWMLRGIHPYRENRKDVEGWVVSVSFDVSKSVAQQKILSYLSPDWIVDVTMVEGRKDNLSCGTIDTLYVKNVFGGVSKLTFKSCQEGRTKFQGTSLDFVWFDEEPPEDIYEECLMRVVDKRGDIFGTMTPLMGLTWVYDEIFLNAHNSQEIWFIQMEWRDNPFLNAEEVDNLIASTSDDLQETRRFGNFHAEGGRVFTEFEPSVHIIDPFPVPVSWQAGISIDPGLHNPLSCHFYAVDGDGVIYVVGEHYEAKRDINYHIKKIHELAESLQWRYDSKGRLNALIDSAAEQHTLAYTKSVAELFYEGGILVNTKVDKNVFSGISRMKSLFYERPPRIYIFKSCVNMIRELKGYWWGNGDRPKKIDDHSVDDLRYFVMSRPEPNPILFERDESFITKDKEKLITKLRHEGKRL